MKEVKFVERVHQWEGKAIVRAEGELKEVNLGVITTDKKLKETGVKELFEAAADFPHGVIAVEVVKLDDISTTYVMSSDDFKKYGKATTIEETTPAEDAAATCEPVPDQNNS